MSKKARRPARRATSKRMPDEVCADNISTHLLKMLDQRYGIDSYVHEPWAETVIESRPPKAAVLSTTEAVVQQSNVFTLSDEAAAAVYALAERCETLTDRLLGQEPQNGATGDPMPVSSGLFNSLDAAMRCVLHNVARTHKALSRIEQATP
jgi:hypothetical protein